MSNWIPITLADLNDAKVAALVDALRMAALAQGQTDPSPRIVQDTVNYIRRKIASCAKNQVDLDATTVPAGLKEMAVDLVLARLKGRLEIDLTTDEKDRLSRHETDLNRIASCTDAVEQPDNATPPPVQSTAGTPSISPRKRRPCGC